MFGPLFVCLDVEKLHAAVAKCTFESQNVKKLTIRTTFGSSDVEKLPAAVAKCTFESQNVKKLSCFGALFVCSPEMSKKLHGALFDVLRRCGESHISASSKMFKNC